MVIQSFIVASVGTLVVLLVILRANRATYVRGRDAMARELSHFLDDARGTDPDKAAGTWRGLPVRVALNTYSIDYEVDLPHAVLPYRVLVERFGGSLAERMRALEMRVEGDRLVGSTARENGLAEGLITVEKRIGMAQELRALRQHVPRELVRAIDNAHSSQEVDALLVQLATHFPDHPETSEAVEHAVSRDHRYPDHLRGRMKDWLVRPPISVVGSRP